MVHQTLQAKEVSESDLSGLFLLLLILHIYMESKLKRNGNVPQFTCVSIAGFVSHSARTCSFSSSPAVPAAKQIWLAG